MDAVRLSNESSFVILWVDLLSDMSFSHAEIEHELIEIPISRELIGSARLLWRNL